MPKPSLGCARPLTKATLTRDTTLGLMYVEGLGVPQDYAQALAWFRKAADQGNATAQYNIGAMYNEGRGVPQDFTQAAAWFRKSAEQGIAAAQYNLGLMYAKAQGVPQDSAQAYMWLNLAADKGHKDSIKLRDLSVRYLTPSQIEEGQRLTRAWLAAQPKAQGGGQ